MRIWVMCAMLSLVLAGCAENGEQSDGTQAASDETGSGDSATKGGADDATQEVDPSLGIFNATLIASSNGTAGEPFNITLEADLPDDAAMNASWTATVANETGFVEEATGLGVPATFGFVLAAGNYTIETVVAADGYNNATALQAFTIADVAGEIVPGIPEDLRFTGTLEGPTFSGIPGDSSSHTFTLDVPVESMRFSMGHGRIAGVPEADHDIDWSWSGPGVSGSAADYWGPEDDVTFSNPPLGEWTVTMELYSSPTEVDYTLDILFT